MKDENNLKLIQNKRLIFSLAITAAALSLTLFDNSIMNNGLLGICVLISTYSMMKLQKK